MSAADVGHRVMVRYAHPDGGFADVLGILESWDAETLRIRRRDNSVAEVPATTLVAGKRVPPPPPRRPR